MERLRHLIVKAVDVLESDLESEDLKLRQSAAIHILKAVKIYGGIGEPTGSTSAEAIESEWEDAEQMKELFSSLKSSMS